MNPFRVLVSPLSKTIYAGRVKHLEGYAESIGQRHDVTRDVLAAVVEYVGVGNTVTVSVGGAPMFEIEVRGVKP